MKLLHQRLRPVVFMGLLAQVFIPQNLLAEAINPGGSGGFGFECDATNKICTCEGGKDSLDCRAMAKNCSLESIGKVRCFDFTYDANGKITNSKSNQKSGKNCECLMAKTTNTVPKPIALPETQLVAPTRDEPHKPTASNRLQVKPIVAVKPQGIIAPNIKTTGSPNRAPRPINRITAPRNAKCVRQDKAKLVCEFSGHKYDCNSQRQNCTQISIQSRRQNSILKKDKANSGNKAMHFDEADALFGKRTDPAKEPIKSVK